MKVWIHIDGTQQGPFELDELPLDKMSPETPVWYEGLANWVPAAKAAETARFFASQDQPQPALAQEQAFVGNSSHAFEPVQAQMANQVVENQCPDTYIVWSVLLTVLCCNPIGFIPIILGTMVTSKYRNYNYEGAKRTSETTAWWLMITIVTSLMCIPLSLLSLI